ncbi:hypothetical protein [Pantoea sp. Fr+CA_20]|uniref:hypothetical protein n=1 Tax=Pantoea sp. Fr+CA_20 TaxID=2929506 RepID=UPI00211891D5|nr:hypothetical protein [Pantoea sp. Fr+CA_20]
MKLFTSPLTLTGLLRIATETAVALTVMRLALTHTQMPVTKTAAMLLSGVQYAGGLVVTCCFIAGLFYQRYRLRVLLYGFTTFTVLMATVGNFADSLLEKPGLLMVILTVYACCLTVGAVCQLAIRMDHEQPAGVRFDTPMSVEAARPVTEQDRRVIAAHEAGHALLYAAWSPLPDTLRVQVKNRTDGSHSLGFVNSGVPLAQLTEKETAEWQMLLCLAGTAGERCYMSRVSLGAVNDATRWLDVATAYLSCHLRDGVFYPEPASELEIDCNQRHLAALRNTQNARLEAFFDVNRGVHARLTETLLEDGSQAGAALLPFLADVQLPEDFPRVNNPGSSS